MDFGDHGFRVVFGDHGFRVVFGDHGVRVVFGDHGFRVVLGRVNFGRVVVCGVTGGLVVFLIGRFVYGIRVVTGFFLAGLTVGRFFPRSNP